MSRRILVFSFGALLVAFACFFAYKKMHKKEHRHAKISHVHKKVGHVVDVKLKTLSQEDDILEVHAAAQTTVPLESLRLEWILSENTSQISGREILNLKRRELRRKRSLSMIGQFEVPTSEDYPVKLRIKGHTAEGVQFDYMKLYSSPRSKQLEVIQSF